MINVLDEAVKWLFARPSLLIAINVALVALVVAVLGLIFTLWIKPKLAKLDSLTANEPLLAKREDLVPLASSIAALETVTNGLPDKVTEITSRMDKADSALSGISELGNLRSRIDRIEAAREEERREQLLRHETTQQTLRDAVQQMHRLREASDEEIRRMLNNNKLSWAIEQAKQDVMLGQTEEVVSRILGTDANNAAKENLARAKARLAEFETHRTQNGGTA